MSNSKNAIMTYRECITVMKKKKSLTVNLNRALFLHCFIKLTQEDIVFVLQPNNRIHCVSPSKYPLVTKDAFH